MRLIWRSVGGLVVVLLIAWVAALNAPSEQSLGTGIRLVYIHVGLIWVGLLGITVAGLCGLVALAFASPWSERWLGPLAWVGLGMFIAGFLFSMPAASVNWGAIFWAEPRYFAISLAICVGLLTQAAYGWLPWLRAKGAIQAGYALYVTFSILLTPLVLHPRNPAFQDGSGLIPYFFVGFFLLFLSYAVWLVWSISQWLQEDMGGVENG
ncbi:MAG: hypothetical protein CL920_36000 [Deltaproteobacteria bacterium]|nr:hypothetical protein [Deltaproteobacteria bacterium]MBU54131.1 hypothetical protein [Deltaproteobacteria bacterium]